MTDALIDGTRDPGAAHAALVTLGVPLAVFLATQEALAAGYAPRSVGVAGKARWRLVSLLESDPPLPAVRATLARVGFRFFDAEPDARSGYPALWPAHWQWRSWWPYELEACECGAPGVAQLRNHSCRCVDHIDLG